MVKTVTSEREFRRQAGPRNMYGCVTITAHPATIFHVDILVEWPPDLETARYEHAIRDGIRKGLSEAGFEKPAGTFRIVDAKFSDDREANVPFAYGEAARQAILDIVKDWQSGTVTVDQ